MSDGFSRYGGWIHADSDQVIVSHKGIAPNTVGVVYTRSGAGWSQEAVLPSGPLQAGSSGMPVLIDGDWAFVANYIEDAEAGRVYVHERLAGGFASAGFLVPATRRSDSAFGRRMAVDGDRLAIGSVANQVHLFEHSAGAWVLQQELTPSGLAYNVDLDGGRLAVGFAVNEHLGGEEQSSSAGMASNSCREESSLRL